MAFGPVVFGHVISDFNYKVATDTIQFKFLGSWLEMPSHDFHNQQMLLKICQPIYTEFLKQGGAAKGSQNGLSGQAAQTVPGNPHLSQLGAAGTQQAFNSRISQLAAANAAFRQQFAASNLAQQYSNALQLANLQQYQAAAPQGNPVTAPEPLKTEGFRLGEIIAWRGWKLTASGFLRSMSADVIWAPDEPMEGKTKSKEEHNGCYAYKTAREFLKNHENSGLDVYGKVALWGDIIEHELGYRAEFAKIVAITDFCKRGGSKSTLTELRERYRLAA